MNRRHFFGMTLAAVTAAGLPALVLPERSIFLPPRYGWKPGQVTAGYMREVEQWVLEDCERRWRYDAIGRDIWGNEHQFHVEARTPCPDVARLVISNRFEFDGLIAIPPQDARQFRLRLPVAVRSAYV